MVVRHRVEQLHPATVRAAAGRGSRPGPRASGRRRPSARGRRRPGRSGRPRARRRSSVPRPPRRHPGRRRSGSPGRAPAGSRWSRRCRPGGRRSPAGPSRRRICSRSPGSPCPEPYCRATAPRSATSSGERPRRPRRAAARAGTACRRPARPPRAGWPPRTGRGSPRRSSPGARGVGVDPAVQPGPARLLAGSEDGRGLCTPALPGYDAMRTINLHVVTPGPGPRRCNPDEVPLRRGTSDLRECRMRHGRLVATGLAAGATLGFLGELLRPVPGPRPRPGPRPCPGPGSTWLSRAGARRRHCRTSGWARFALRVVRPTLTRSRSLWPREVWAPTGSRSPRTGKCSADGTPDRAAHPGQSQ